MAKTVWLCCVLISMLCVLTLWTSVSMQRQPRYSVMDRYDFEPEGLIEFRRVLFSRRRQSSSVAIVQKSAKSITLCTQLSTDRLEKLNNLVLTWQGPVSAAVYVRNETDALAAQAHYDRWPELSKFVDLHLLYANNTRYPANVLRNLALDGAQSDAVFCLDADFVTRLGMHDRLTKSLANWLSGKERGKWRSRDRRVFVVPSFESDRDADMLRFNDKTELLDAMKRDDVVESNMDVCWRCHTPTDYARWYSAKHMYEAQYRWIYEPYIIFSKGDNLPPFHERLMGYGFDKNSHTFHLAVAGHTFHVLPDAFAIHVNHNEAHWDGPTIQEQLWDALAIVCDLIPTLKEQYGYDPQKRLFDEPLPHECYSNHHF